MKTYLEDRTVFNNPLQDKITVLRIV